jgi:hypothetical protein
MAEKLVREVYEVRGFDFTHCCGINSMYNLELGESVMQRLFGMVEFEPPIYRAERKPSFKKWHGRIRGIEGAYLNVSEVSGYLTRVSLVYRESDTDAVQDIKTILGGIKTRTGKKKTLLDCVVDRSKNITDERKEDDVKSSEEKPIDINKLPSCAIYSSN